MLVNMIEKSIAIFQAFVALISGFGFVKYIHICSDFGEIKRLHLERSYRNMLTLYLFDYSQCLIDVLLHFRLACKDVADYSLFVDDERVPSRKVAESLSGAVTLSDPTSFITKQLEWQ